jgi:hypothetical protein
MALGGASITKLASGRLLVVAEKRPPKGGTQLVADTKLVRLQPLFTVFGRFLFFVISLFFNKVCDGRSSPLCSCRVRARVHPSLEV